MSRYGAVIVLDPKMSVFGQQYFTHFGRHWSLSLNGEYEPWGPVVPHWSDKHEDAHVYESRSAADRALRRIVGKANPPFAAVVEPTG